MAAVLLLGFSVMAHLEDFIGDEAVHAYQINWFLEGRFEIFQYVTMVPVYHALNALLAMLLSEGNHETLRLASTLLGALAIPAFLLLVQRCRPDEWQQRTLQFVLLPVYFPLFFLIYTDLLALAPVLLMVERTLGRHYKTAGVCALLAVFVRQPNLVWLGYALWLALLQEHPVHREQPRPIVAWLKALPAGLPGYLRRCWPVWLAVMAFLGFVLLNGGVAVGDAEQHPVSFNPTNAWFLLITAGVLFLPWNLAQGRAVLALLRDQPWLWLLAVLLGVLFMSSFELTHQYNDRSLSFYRHNLVLHAINDLLWLKLAAYLLLVWTLLALASAALAERSNAALVWWLPFALLSVLPLPLVEHRYYLPALALLLALRPPMPERLTALTLGCYLAAASYILYHISRMHFFL